MAKVTVCSVMRERGMDASTPAGKRIAWSAGAAVRDMWAAENDGERPAMRLTPKTNSTGTHEKANYPPGWRDRISDALDAAAIEHGPAGDPRQGVLWRQEER